VTIALPQTLPLIAGNRFSRLPVLLPTSHRFGGALAGVPYVAVRRSLSTQTDGQPPANLSLRIRLCGLVSSAAVTVACAQRYACRPRQNIRPSRRTKFRDSGIRNGVPQTTVIRGETE